MKSLNEVWAESSRQIDRSFELNKGDDPSSKAKPKSDLASRVARQPQPQPAPGKDGAKIMQALADVESRLNKIYDFDSSKYNEKDSAEKLRHLETALQMKGVPQHVIDAGLRQPKTDIGRRGVRHIFHWNAQKPVHTRRIQRSFARMKALVAPVAAAQSRLESVQGIKTAAQRDLAKAETDLANLENRRDNLVGHHKVMGVGKATANELKQVTDEIAELELDIAAGRLVIADADNEAAELTSLIGSFGGDDSAATSHFGRVQGGLDTIGGDQKFQKTYDKLNPGTRKSRFWGYLGKRFANPVKSVARKLFSLGTLGIPDLIMGGLGAVKAQDKARHFATAQHRLPTPAARMMAAVLLDRFDAEAYKLGLGAAIGITHLPMTVHLPWGTSFVSAPLSAAIFQGATSHMHSEVGKQTVGQVYGELKGQFVGSAQDQAVRLGSPRRPNDQFPVPTVPITMGSGDDARVKHVDLTDKKTALALLIHLGPAVDDAKINSNVTSVADAEKARRNLRREIFNAADDEDYSPARMGKKRSSEQKAFDKQLTRALYDPEHENRDDILGQASPLHKMFAAAGLL